MKLRHAIVAIALTLLAAPAHAALLLSASINGVNVCAADNNFTCPFGVPLVDSNAVLGQLALEPILVGGVEITGSLQQAIIGGAFNILNTSTTQITNTNAFAVSGTIAVSATGFTPPVSRAFVSGSATWQDAIGSSVTMSWYNDPANGQGALTPTTTPGLLLYTCSDTVELPADATACSAGPIPVSDLAPFSMTLYTQFTLAPGATLVNRGMTELKPVDQDVVPEPATMVLLGLGFLGAGLARRRR